jgi:hypothetical protein
LTEVAVYSILSLLFLQESFILKSQILLDKQAFLKHYEEGWIQGASNAQQSKQPPQ